MEILPFWPVSPPVADTAVHYPQHGDSAGTLGQEVGEAGSQSWSQLMFSQAPQTLLSCPAAVLQLPQVLSQLLKVHLKSRGYTCPPARKAPPEAASVPGSLAWALGTQLRSGLCPPKAHSLMQEEDKFI